MVIATFKKIDLENIRCSLAGQNLNHFTSLSIKKEFCTF